MHICVFIIPDMHEATDSLPSRQYWFNGIPKQSLLNSKTKFVELYD